MPSYGTHGSTGTILKQGTSLKPLDLTGEAGLEGLVWSLPYHTVRSNHMGICLDTVAKGRVLQSRGTDSGHYAALSPQVGHNRQSCFWQLDYASCLVLACPLSCEPSDHLMIYLSPRRTDLWPSHEVGYPVMCMTSCHRCDTKKWFCRHRPKQVLSALVSCTQRFRSHPFHTCSRCLLCMVGIPGPPCHRQGRQDLG